MAERLVKSQFNFIGGSYTSRSPTFDCERLVNMYVETHDLGGGKNEMPAVLYSTPGLNPIQNIGTGPIRACYTMSNQQLSFIVSGNELYQLNAAGGVPVLIPGNFATSVGFVSICDNGDLLALVDGANIYWVSVTGTTPTLTVVSDPNAYPGSRTVTFLDGYFIFDTPVNTLADYPTSSYYWSNNDLLMTAAGPITFPTDGNTGSAGTNPDPVLAVLTNSEQLYIFGSRTIEVWSDTGASASAPFSTTGRSINVGIVAVGTLTKLADTMLFLGGNEQGAGVVYSMQNDNPTRVSTHAIENMLLGYGDLTNSTAYSYQSGGHYFYVLQPAGANTTLVYDMTTQLWHERQSLVNGIMGRHLGQYACFLNGTHIIGDYATGALYKYDNNYFMDGTNPLRRLRQTGHSAQGVANVFYKTLQVDIQPGVGTLTINPRIVLCISDDGGMTWGNPIYSDMGYVGAYTTRARWQRLGYGRDLVFQVYCDDPVNVVFLAAYIEFEVGQA